MPSPIRRRRAPLFTAILTLGLLCASAGPALANTTLLVNGTTGNDGGGNTCQLTPCKTIQNAIVQGRSVADSVTINVAAGAYMENIALNQLDGGLRIVGAGNGSDPGANTVITAAAAGPAIATNTASSLALSSLRLATLVGNPAPVVDGQADLGLEDVVIDDQGNGAGINLSSGDLVARGGSVTAAASSSSGDGVRAGTGSVTLTGTPVVVRGTGNGVYASTRISVTGAPVRLENPTNSSWAIYSGKGGDVTDTPVEHRGTGTGVYASSGSLTLSGGSVDLTNAANSQYAVYASAPNASIRMTNTPVTHAGTGYGVYAGSGGIDITGAGVKLTNATNSGYAVYSSGGVRTANAQILQAGTGYGVYASNSAADLTDGSVTLSNPTNSQYAVYAGTGRLRSRNVTVLQAGTGYGVYASSGDLDVSGGSVSLPNTANSNYAAYASNGDVMLSDLAITQAGNGYGVYDSGGVTTLRRSTITAGNAAGFGTAVSFGNGRATIESSTITSSSKGSALDGAGSTSISDSTITGGAPGGTLPAVRVFDGSGHSMVIRRSTVRQTQATQPTLLADRVNLTVDSSELLGGSGLAFSVGGGASRLLAVSGSTLDAGAPGVRDGGIAAIAVTTDNSAGTFARATVQGSILVEAPTVARAGTNATAAMTCSSTEVPSTVQATAPTLGSIACGVGTAGNTSTASLAAIFASPGSGFTLNPSWNGVDSVPAGAIALPAGQTPSTTDVAGSPRVLNAAGTCAPGIQDKGAVELTGRGGVVPAPVISGPATAVAGQAVTLTGSAPNLPPGSPASYSWTTSDGGTGNGASLTRAFAAPGSVTATLTVTGGAGCTASRTASIAVAAAAGSSAKARITNLKLSPKAFAAAAKGASIAKAKAKATGTAVSYRNSAAVVTRLTVQRAATGRLKGRTCAKPSPANKGGKRCTRYTTAGSFTHEDKAGANSFRFTGRVGGRTLGVGAYRLTAVPGTGAARGAAVATTFSVIG